jgi:hypothetical protein
LNIAQKFNYSERLVAMMGKKNSGIKKSKDPEFQNSAIAQIDSAVKSLKSLRKALLWTKDLLSSSDPYFEEIAKKMKPLDVFPDTGPLALLVPLAIQEIEGYRARLEEIKKQRSDVRNRREEFVRMAGDSGFVIQCMGTTDFSGPYKVEHVEQYSSIWFGKYRLQKIAYPSGGNIFNTLREVSGKLEEEALHGWAEFMDQIVAAQERISHTEFVPWKNLFNAVLPNIAQQRRLGSLFCYRLSILISGKAPGGWKAITAPPALSEQRSAWGVPRLDKTNEIVRVYRLRLRKLSDQTSDSGGVITPPVN